MKTASNIKFLLITGLVLLFSCGKKYESGGGGNADRHIKTEIGDKVTVKEPEESIETRITNEERLAIRKIALLIESELRKNKVFYLNLTTNIEDSDCKIFKETYKKLEVDGYKMTTTEVSDYFIYTTKEDKPLSDCERRDLDRTTYTRNGVFTSDDLTNEIETIFLTNKSIYYSIGVSNLSINLKRSTLFAKNVTLELDLTPKASGKNESVVFSQVYDDYRFFLFKLTRHKGEDVISKTTFDYIPRGSDTVAEKKFNLLAHVQGSKAEDTAEYLSLF